MGVIFFSSLGVMPRSLCVVLLALAVCVVCQSPTNTPIGPGDITQTESPPPVISVTLSPTRAAVADSPTPSGTRRPNPSISESPPPSASVPESPSAPPSSSVPPTQSNTPSISESESNAPSAPNTPSITPDISPSVRKSPDPTPTNSPVFYYERPLFSQPDDSVAGLFEVILDGNALYTDRPGRPLCSGEQFAQEAAEFLSLDRVTDVRVISIFDCEITVLICGDNVDELLNYITFEPVDPATYPSFVNAFVETNVNWDVTCDSYSRELYYFQYGYGSSSPASALAILLGLNLILAFLF